MVRDLYLDVKIEVLPIVREKDGLALSSRNEYLDKRERQAALVLYRSLQKAKKMIMEGERKAAQIIEKMKERIGKEQLAEIDYVDIVDLDELSSVEVIGEEALIALAVYVGKTRLIDNMIVEIDEKGVKFKE